jgi:hypothetical protein
VVETSIGLGVECTTCYTVYFIERPTNRDRFYCASHKPAQFSRWLLHQELDVDEWLGVAKSVWKPLCICSEQVCFNKAQLKWYSAPRDAFKRGRAVQGEWRRVDGPLPPTPRCFAELCLQTFCTFPREFSSFRRQAVTGSHSVPGHGSADLLADVRSSVLPVSPPDVSAREGTVPWSERQSVFHGHASASDQAQTLPSRWARTASVPVGA